MRASLRCPQNGVGGEHPVGIHLLRYSIARNLYWGISLHYHFLSTDDVDTLLRSTQPLTREGIVCFPFHKCVNFNALFNTRIIIHREYAIGKIWPSFLIGTQTVFRYKYLTSVGIICERKEPVSFQRRSENIRVYVDLSG